MQTSFAPSQNRAENAERAFQAGQPVFQALMVSALVALMGFGAALGYAAVFEGTWYAGPMAALLVAYGIGGPVAITAMALKETAPLRAFLKAETLDA